MAHPQSEPLPTPKKKVSPPPTEIEPGRFAPERSGAGWDSEEGDSAMRPRDPAADDDAEAPMAPKP